MIDLISQIKLHLLRVNEQIFRLDVSVDHIFAMTVFDSLEQLVNVLTDKYLIDAVGVLF